MQAAIQKQYGSPQVLDVQEVDAPAIKNDEILIRVHASSVTQGDRRLRAADFPGITAIAGRLMFGIFSPRNATPGTNLAGKVVAIGSDVTRYAVGDDVFGGCDHSAYAELIALKQDAALSKMPPNLSYDEAAAVPYGAATALAFLRDVAKVKPGERVLIVGASGGVGRFAVQLAKHFGAHVTGVCSSEKSELVRGLGADQVIDYATQDYWAGDDRYDVIFDTYADGGFRRARPALTQSGRFLTLYLNLSVLFQMLLTSFGAGPRLLSSVVLGNRALLADVAHLLTNGAIWPVVAKRYDLAYISEAHDALEEQNPFGTVVITLNKMADAA